MIKFVIVLITFVLVLASAKNLNGVMNALLERTPLEQLLSLPNIQEQYYDQKLDHFDASSPATFKQRYFVNTAFLKNASHAPIVFIVIGGEGPISDYYATSTEPAYFANQFNGLVVAVEHRYYGKSQPFSDLATKNLKYLSVEQAIQDIVTFRSLIAKQFNAQNSKFVTFGASYSANIASWARLKHPDLFTAALASSGPVRALVDFKEYLFVVTDSLGGACSSRIRSAVTAIQEKLQTQQGRSDLSLIFNTCKPISDKDLDQVTFFEDISDAVAEVVQYNNPQGGYNITSFCNNMLNQSVDPLHAYANFMRHRGKCVESNYQAVLDQLRNLSPSGPYASMRAWTWQYCTEFGYLQSAQDQAPFSHRITAQWFIQQCRDTFDIADMYPQATKINDMFGGDHPSGSQTIFTNGEIDPWHFLSVLENIGASQIAIVLPRSSHCSDFRWPSVNDPVHLKAARTKIQQYLQQWLQ